VGDYYNFTHQLTVLKYDIPVAAKRWAISGVVTTPATG